jgi:hypothetical protein
MSISHSLSFCVAASFGAALLSIGCSTVKVDTGRVENTATVVVAGKSDKLLKFDSNVRLLLGIGDDDSDTLGCDRCAALRGGNAEIGKLTYYIPRKPEKIFRELAIAWNDVWYDPSNPHDAKDGERLTMMVDANMADAPLCEGFSQPCSTRPSCPAQGYCSKNPPGKSCSPKCQ